MSVNQEIRHLMKEIEYHNKKYYIDASPSISDLEYDKLFTRLLELEGTYPEFADKNSPTSRVGGDVLDSFPVVSHKVPMLSLSNVYSTKGLAEFFDRIEKLSGGGVSYSAEPKLDGVSISLIYKNGRLEAALTRGDGKRGNYVTENVRTIRSLPLVLDDDISMELRGEIFFPRKAFELFNKAQLDSGSKHFANARNAAAGSIKLLNSKEVSKRPLDIFIYSLVSSSSSLSNSHFKRLSYLKGLGFKINPHSKFFSSREGIEDYISFWSEEKGKVDYDTDGIVIKLDSINLHSVIGSTFRAPKWAVAYKFPGEQRSTVVNDIELSVGSTGAVTPIAILEPIELGNTVVSRASLHNFGELMKKGVRVSDRVFVEKGGEIIPQVSSVILSERPSGSKSFIIPKSCPSCASSLEDDISLVFNCANISCSGLSFDLKYRGIFSDLGEGTVSLYPSFLSDLLFNREAFLPKFPCPVCSGVLELNLNYIVRCINLSCTSKLSRRISNFVSKDAMDIQGFGSRIVSLLLKERIISSYADIYYMGPEELLALEGFGEKSVALLLDSIEMSKSMPLSRLINALGIFGIGSKQAMVLADKFSSLDNIMSASLEDLEECVGSKAALNVLEFFGGERELIERLRYAGVSFDSISRVPMGDIADNFFSDKKFAVTGVLEGLSRKEASDMITERGGIFVSSPSRDTDYIIVGEKAGAGKLEKAKKFNIEQLSGLDFFKHILL